MKINFRILFVLVFLLYYEAYSENKEYIKEPFTVISGDYTYKFNKVQNINLENTNDNTLRFMIQRENYPLVNRLVKFISLTPEYFTFEGNTNTVVVSTDENGVASIPVIANDAGRGIVAIHMLYVGSTGNTNISYETFVDVIVNKDMATNFLPSLVFIYALFAPIIIILIGYYKRIKKSYLPKLIMKVLFGFSAIRKDFILMQVISLAAILIVVLELFVGLYYVPLIFTALSVITFSMKNSRAYSIIFLLFSILSGFIIAYNIIIKLNPIDISTIENTRLVSNFIFVFFLFLITTAFLSSLYIPISLFILYKYTFMLPTISILAGLLGIFIASICYIVQYKYRKKTLPIFYIINILRIGE